MEAEIETSTDIEEKGNRWRAFLSFAHQKLISFSKSHDPVTSQNNFLFHFLTFVKVSRK